MTKIHFSISVTMSCNNTLFTLHMVNASGIPPIPEILKYLFKALLETKLIVYSQLGIRCFTF